MVKETKTLKANQQSSEQTNMKYDSKSNSSFNLSDIGNKVGNSDYFEINKHNSRKNSNESECYSTSNEDYHEKEKLNGIKTSNKNKKKLQKKNKNKEEIKINSFGLNKKYKTELCKYFEIRGYCKYGENCIYAHGEENLRLKVTNTNAYRTKKCYKFFENGYCPYGNRCQFAHQLASNIINNPYDKKMTYTKILEIFSEKEKIAYIDNIVEKERLPVFKEIVRNEEKIPRRLFNDFKNLDLNEKNFY